MDIIIGAGTAGLSAGRVLENNGREYLIIDQKSEIGKPVRSTGAISTSFANKLNMPLEKDIIASRIYSVSIQNDSDSVMTIRSRNPIGFVYDFTKYEKFLGRKLNIQLNERVTSIEGNVVRTENGKYNADNIIVATGPVSNLVPYKLNEGNGYWIGYEEIRKLPPRSDANLKVWFSRLASPGYVWDFPGRPGRRKVGLGFSKANGWNPKKQLQEFTLLHPEIDAETTEIASHLLRISRPPDKVVIGNRLYIGDAASACFATNGGGLHGAFWTGKEAALSLVKGNPQYYQKFWESKLKPLLNKHYKIRKLMDRNGLKRWDQFLEMMNGFTLWSLNERSELIRAAKYVVMRNPLMFLRFLGYFANGIFAVQF